MTPQMWVGTGLFAIGVIIAGIGYLGLITRLSEVFSRLSAVEEVAATLKKSRDEATMDAVTGVLTDPDRLDAELDKAGQLSEMRRARRRHLPRENAGSPAKVSKMRFTR